MAADVKTLVQFSVFLVNKPGVLAQVTGALAAEKINLVAMTLVDSQEHGVLRMVIENPAEARQVLKKLNLPMTETEVLCVDLPNRPGALADFFTIDLDDVSIAGAGDDALLSSIVFSLERTAIRDVWIAGRAVVKDRNHLLATEVVARFQALQQRLWK